MVFRNSQSPALIYMDNLLLSRRTIRILIPKFRKLRANLALAAKVTHRLPNIQLPVVNSIEGDHLHFFIDHVDERQEEEPLQAVEVEVARGSIRGQEANHVVLEKRFEQPFEYHRIRNMEHLELINSKQVDFF